MQTPPGPGARAPGLAYFRLEPSARDTTYRLLVIPVRFPEDSTVAPGGPVALAPRLHGEGTGSVEGYYLASTNRRLRIVADLAPTVTAEHPRPYYTSEGDANTGYGLDPRAYPHNARRLVEEVTTRLEGAVDFRRYDNTGDDIADGLLLVHSGPTAPEAISAGQPRDLLAAHSFTLENPAPRGDAFVFPYAVVSARDAIGPWVHEIGHLLGLPDLYRSNPLCFGEGVGDWALMATGANRHGGQSPSGLCAFSRQLLGMVPTVAVDGRARLDPGVFLRVFRAGEAQGPEYFLVERRAGRNGLAVPYPATLVYAVNEEAVDNRNCTHALVEIRAEVCAGTRQCAVTLGDDSVPNLRDHAGRPTELALTFSQDEVTVHQGGPLPLRLERVRLLAPRMGQETTGMEQPLEITVRNLSRTRAVTALLEVERVDRVGLCVHREGSAGPRIFAANATQRDTTWVIAPCAAGTEMPVATGRISFLLVPEEGGSAVIDTLMLVTGPPGLAANRLTAFVPQNKAPGRDNPWVWNGVSWSGTAPPILGDAELVSPWFSVPRQGVLILDHAWSLTALSPDVALDGAQIRLDPQIGPETPLRPPLGWGYTAERGTGNALGGEEVIAGSGDRLHMFDLEAWEGQTVRLQFRIAGDAVADEGFWTIRQATVQEGSPAAFRLAWGETGDLLVLANGFVSGGTQFWLYSGPAPIVADRPLAHGVWKGSFTIPPDGVSGHLRRFDLVWRGPDGGGGEADLIHLLPTQNKPVPIPVPNPVRVGQPQQWSVFVPNGEGSGRYVFTLLDVHGRQVLRRQVLFVKPGRRDWFWDGRDAAGRALDPGVYFLRVQDPRGDTQARRLVVLP